MAFDGLFKAEQNEKYEIFKTFYNNIDLPFKTDLTLEQINGIIKAEFLESFLKNEWDITLKIKDLVTIPLKEHLVSKNRQGRVEMVEVLRPPRIEEEPEKEKGRIRTLLGI